MAKSLVKNSIYNIVYQLVTAIYPLVAVTYVSHILMSNNNSTFNINIKKTSVIYSKENQQLHQ